MIAWKISYAFSYVFWSFNTNLNVQLDNAARGI